MKTKVTIEEVKNEDDSFPMSEMEPGQICIIETRGHICVRGYGDEVWDISNDDFWQVPGCNILVKQAPKGTKVIFEVI